MGLYYNATDGNTLSDVCSLERTIETVAHAYEKSKSMLVAVITMVMFGESGTNVEEMRSAIAPITKKNDEFAATHRAYTTHL